MRTSLIYNESADAIFENFYPLFAIRSDVSDEGFHNFQTFS